MHSQSSTATFSIVFSLHCAPEQVACPVGGGVNKPHCHPPDGAIIAVGGFGVFGFFFKTRPCKHKGDVWLCCLEDAGKGRLWGAPCRGWGRRAYAADRGEGGGQQCLQVSMLGLADCCAVEALFYAPFSIFPSCNCRNPIAKKNMAKKDVHTTRKGTLA